MMRRAAGAHVVFGMNFEEIDLTWTIKNIIRVLGLEPRADRRRMQQLWAELLEFIDDVVPVGFAGLGPRGDSAEYGDAQRERRMLRTGRNPYAAIGASRVRHISVLLAAIWIVRPLIRKNQGVPFMFG